MSKQVAKEKKPATIGLYHRIRVFDKDGKLKSDTGKKESHSFVKGFIMMLLSIMCDRVSFPLITETDGSTTSLSAKSIWINTGIPADLTAPAGNENYGIQIGTGTTPETNEDITIETRIDDGLGAGQIQYGIQVWNDTKVEGGYVKWEVYRSFSNGSGGSITINEIALVVQMSGGVYVLNARDKLGAGITVASSDVALIEYEWRTAV